MALQNSSIDEMNTFLNKIYCIPNYQREYSWEIEELEDFWNDLCATIDEKDETHFFGQVVVHEEIETNTKYIIDGQQRTTTSMIFLRALQIHFSDLEKNGNKQAEYKRADIESIYLGRESERHLTLGEMDNEYYEESILSDIPSSLTKKEGKKSHERLRKAYLFFDEKIGHYIEGIDEDEAVSKLICMYNAFIKRFKVLYMEATKLDEAFVIFETLNARGRDLETSDLLKNYILNHTGEINSSLKQWNSMINRLDRCDITKYIRNYWNATHEFTREKALYREINRNISTPKKTKELLSDLDKLSQYYHDMVVPSENNDESIKHSFLALKTLKASTFYPVFIAMRKQGSFSSEDYNKVAKKLKTMYFGILRFVGSQQIVRKYILLKLQKKYLKKSLHLLMLYVMR